MISKLFESVTMTTSFCVLVSLLEGNSTDKIKYVTASISIAKLDLET